MSFRQYGGINYASKHNIVSSNFNTSNNLLVPQNVGKPNSIITFLSDISGNLTIYGNVNVDNGLTVREDIDCSNNLTVDNDITGKGDLFVQGDVHCSNNLTVENDITGKGDLLVQGSINSNNNLTVQNTITSKGDLLVQGNVDFINNLTVENDITSKGDLLVQGNIDCNSNLTVQSDTIIKRNLTVEGTTFFTATPNFTTDLNVEGSLYVNEDVKSNNLNIEKKVDIKGDLIVNGSLDLGNKENNTSTINLSGATSLFIKSDEHKNYNSSQFHIKTSDSNYNGISFGINSEKYCYLQSYKYNQSNSVHSIQPLLLNPNGGNVGISKNNPEYTLDVNGDSNFSNNMYTKTIYSSNDGTSHLSFTAENGNCFIKSFSNDINGSTWSPIHFTNGFSNSSPKYYMSIVPNSNGNSVNIGINNSNPVLPLDVNGNTKITGNLDVTGVTTLYKNLDVSGNSKISGNLDVSGNSKITRNLDVSGITTLSNILNISSNGIKFANNTTQITAYTGVGDVPIGAIVMWSNYNGAEIPAGWQLCDGGGNPPRPNLLDQFIVGAGLNYKIGDTGGTNKVGLLTSEIPSHSHSIQDPQHSHSYTDPKHSHQTRAPLGEVGRGSGSQENADDDYAQVTSTQSTVNIVIQQASTGITGTQLTGGGGEHENRPPYYALAFIIRTS